MNSHVGCLVLSTSLTEGESGRLGSDGLEICSTPPPSLLESRSKAVFILPAIMRLANVC